MKDGVWEEGAEDAEDAGEEARGGGRYRSKNKNPTQGLREKSQCKTIKRHQLKSRRTQTYPVHRQAKGSKNVSLSHVVSRKPLKAPKQKRGLLEVKYTKKNRAQDSKKPGNPLQFSKYSR